MRNYYKISQGPEMRDISAQEARRLVSKYRVRGVIARDRASVSFQLGLSMELHISVRGCL